MGENCRCKIEHYSASEWDSTYSTRIIYCDTHARAATYEEALRKIRDGQHLDTCSKLLADLACDCHVAIAKEALGEMK